MTRVLFETLADERYLRLSAWSDEAGIRLGHDPADPTHDTAFRGALPSALATCLAERSASP
ncbi:hypothetical protein ABZ915_23625 [Streptomyces sp. NPDC046915]|uniref:hypothetical protein n=1 Tax=Streptomyces sp. NPDC046915 TaxID=3155257 RepID=UPI0033D13207